MYGILKQFSDRCEPWKIASGAEDPCFAGAAVSTDEYLPQSQSRSHAWQFAHTVN
jgi:hypothetical protein